MGFRTLAGFTSVNVRFTSGSPTYMFALGLDNEHLVLQCGL